MSSKTRIVMGSARTHDMLASQVTEDTKDILNIKDAVILRSPLRRDNLFYEVRLKPSEHQKTLDDMEKAIKCNFEGQSGDWCGGVCTFKVLCWFFLGAISLSVAWHCSFYGNM